MIRCCIALAGLFAALFGTPAVAIAAAPYEGRWTEDPAWCSHTGDNDEMPVTITPRSIETFASSCRIISATRKGAMWRIRTRCRDEGQSPDEPRQRETFWLRVDGSKLSMRGSTGIVNRTRCAR